MRADTALRARSAGWLANWRGCWRLAGDPAAAPRPGPAAPPRRGPARGAPGAVDARRRARPAAAGTRPSAARSTTSPAGPDRSAEPASSSTWTSVPGAAQQPGDVGQPLGVRHGRGPAGEGELPHRPPSRRVDRPPAAGGAAPVSSASQPAARRAAGRCRAACRAAPAAASASPERGREQAGRVGVAAGEGDHGAVDPQEPASGRTSRAAPRTAPGRRARRGVGQLADEHRPQVGAVGPPAAEVGHRGDVPARPRPARRPGRRSRRRRRGRAPARRSSGRPPRRRTRAARPGRPGPGPAPAAATSGRCRCRARGSARPGPRGLLDQPLAVVEPAVEQRQAAAAGQREVAVRGAGRAVEDRAGRLSAASNAGDPAPAARWRAAAGPRRARSSSPARLGDRDDLPGDSIALGRRCPASTARRAGPAGRPAGWPGRRRCRPSASALLAERPGPGRSSATECCSSRASVAVSLRLQRGSHPGDGGERRGRARRRPRPGGRRTGRRAARRPAPPGRCAPGRRPGRPRRWRAGAARGRRPGARPGPARRPRPAARRPGAGRRPATAAVATAARSRRRCPAASPNASAAQSAAAAANAQRTARSGPSRPIAATKWRASSAAATGAAALVPGLQRRRQVPVQRDPPAGVEPVEQRLPQQVVRRSAARRRRGRACRRRPRRRRPRRRRPVQRRGEHVGPQHRTGHRRRVEDGDGRRRQRGEPPVDRVPDRGRHAARPGPGPGQQRELADEERVAAGAAVHGRRVHAVRPATSARPARRRRPRRARRPGGARPRRSQRGQPARRCRRQLVAPVRADQPDPGRGRRPGQEVEQRDRRLVGPLQVVEDHQQRAGRGQRVEQPAGGVEGEQPVPARLSARRPSPRTGTTGGEQRGVVADRGPHPAQPGGADQPVQRLGPRPVAGGAARRRRTVPQPSVRPRRRGRDRGRAAGRSCRCRPRRRPAPWSAARPDPADASGAGRPQQPASRRARSAPPGHASRLSPCPARRRSGECARSDLRGPAGRSGALSGDAPDPRGGRHELRPDRSTRPPPAQQWEDAAEAWHRWGPTLETLARPGHRPRCSTPPASPPAAACSTSPPAPAGRRSPPPGGPAPAAASWPPTSPRRSSTYAAKAAAEAGLTNVETLEADGETLDGLPAAGFDAVISRVGLIYFPDQRAALAGMRRALRPGGRVAAIVYSTPDRNEFFSVPVSIIRERAAAAAAAARPARAVQPRRARRARGGAAPTAGFRDVDASRPCRRRCGCRRRPSACGSSGSRSARCTRCSPACPRPSGRRCGRRSRHALGRFEAADGFVGPCELLVASATR